MSTVDASSPDLNADTLIERAKRAFALQKFEEAVELYANALEKITKDVAEDSPEIADLYFSYGKALLENAISQNSVIGKEESGEACGKEAPDLSKSDTGPFLSFSGDAEDEEYESVDEFGQPVREDANGDADEGEDEDSAEPEDDFNAAWEVLDLARTIYSKQDGDSEEVKLKLADTYIMLGDVSLETEKFSLAIRDYEAALALKTQIFSISSRHIAEAHYKLSIVLDLTSGRLSDSIFHAEKALESLESRLAELRERLNQLHQGEVKNGLEDKDKEPKGSRVVLDNVVQNMSKSLLEAEIAELTGLKDDVALKVEELKTSPNNIPSTTAPALAAQELDSELNAAPSASAPATVNDLTMLVVRKKKAPSETGGNNGLTAKRKAEPDGESSADKKAKLEEAIS